MKPHADIAEHCLSLHRTIAVKETPRSGFATNGVAIRHNLVLTTYHAIEDATDIFMDVERATCVDCHWSYDFSLVRGVTRIKQPTPIICEPPQHGEPVFVVLRRRSKLQVVSDLRIKSFGLQTPYARLAADDTPLKQGDSGSPIFAFDGILVGIVQMVETANPGCLPCIPASPGGSP